MCPLDVWWKSKGKKQVESPLRHLSTNPEQACRLCSSISSSHSFSSAVASALSLGMVMLKSTYRSSTANTVCQCSQQGEQHRNFRRLIYVRTLKFPFCPVFVAVSLPPHCHWHFSDETALVLSLQFCPLLLCSFFATITEHIYQPLILPDPTSTSAWVPLPDRSQIWMELSTCTETTWRNFCLQDINLCSPTTWLLV